MLEGFTARLNSYTLIKACENYGIILYQGLPVSCHQECQAYFVVWALTFLLTRVLELEL
jgi:hypothetical protein